MSDEAVVLVSDIGSCLEKMVLAHVTAFLSSYLGT